MTRTSQPRPSGAGALAAYLEGWRRVLMAPAVTLGLLAVTVLTALPLAPTLQGALRDQLGASFEVDRALAGWKAAWAAELARQVQSGIGETFSSHIIGFGGTLDGISRRLDGRWLEPGVAAAVGAYLVVWILLSGGLVDRFARGRPTGAAGFFGACGAYALRFLRLAVVVGLADWALFHWLRPFLLDSVYGRWARDMTREHETVWLRAGLYAAFAGALTVVGVAADFAMVRLVVEDRRSVIGALAAATRFVRRRPVKIAGLVALNWLAWLVLLRLWFQAAPLAATPTWAALLMAPAYLLGRILTKLAFMASEVVLFQGELAHAGYTAARPRLWPDGSAVETRKNQAHTRR